MNLHTIQSQGEGPSLGPITVKRLFPFKPGDKSLFLIASDATGECAVKIWGAGAHCGVQEGQVITLTGAGPKGGLKTNEYNGKVSINANDCRVDIQGSNPAPQTQAAPQPAASQHADPLDDKLPSVMKRCARATSLYIDEMVVNHGFSRDEAIMLAQNCPAWYSLWWFGEKGV